jgi:hypothetical protein
MKGQYGRPAERDRQRETEDKRGSVCPTPAPRPHSPAPRAALDVQAAFSQGIHSAKLGHSLKPSDASHQHQTHGHELATHSQPLGAAAASEPVCPNPGTPAQDQALHGCKHSDQQTGSGKVLGVGVGAETARGEAKQGTLGAGCSNSGPGQEPVPHAVTTLQARPSPTQQGSSWQPAVCLCPHQTCPTCLKYY